MDELFICPDCYELHDEPGEATLGHLVRCLSCAINAELTLPIFPVELPVAA